MIISREDANTILHAMGYELPDKWPEDEVLETLGTSPFHKRARVYNESCEGFKLAAKMMSRLAHGDVIEIGETTVWGSPKGVADGDTA